MGRARVRYMLDGSAFRWVRRFAAALAFATAGGVVAQAIKPATSFACSCIEPTWAVSLRSIEGPGAAEQALFWPSAGELTLVLDNAFLRLSTDSGAFMITAREARPLTARAAGGSQP
jgi:hypothetical protein